jgi:hypothetical protein
MIKAVKLRQVRLDAALDDRIVDLARRSEMSVNEMVCTLLERGLRREARSRVSDQQAN